MFSEGIREGPVFQFRLIVVTRVKDRPVKPVQTALAIGGLESPSAAFNTGRGVIDAPAPGGEEVGSENGVGDRFYLMRKRTVSGTVFMSFLRINAVNLSFSRSINV
jgi:hypothetical protein